jgi:hypothetical protein
MPLHDEPHLDLDPLTCITFTVRIEPQVQDAGVEDHVSTHRSGSDAEDTLFAGETVTGPNTVTYELPPLDPGTYVFRSDLHPNMRAPC